MARQASGSRQRRRLPAGVLTPAIKIAVAALAGFNDVVPCNTTLAVATGVLAGKDQVWISDDFDELDEQSLRDWYEGPVEPR